MDQEELREQFNFKEEPTISNRIRFIMHDLRYSQTDRIEYLAYIIFGLGGIGIAFLLIIVGLLSNLGVRTSLWIGLGILLILLYIVPIWRKLRKINERFIYPYRLWVGGEEYAKIASTQFNQMMQGSIMRGQQKGNTAFLWTARLLFGLYTVFYIAGILFSLVYHQPLEISCIVVIGGGTIFIIGVIVLRKDILRYIQAVRQNPLMVISISLLIVLIAAILGLFCLDYLGLIQLPFL